LRAFIKKFGTKRRFEGADPSANSCLINSKLLAGLAQAASPRDSEEMANIIPIHNYITLKLHVLKYYYNAKMHNENAKIQDCRAIIKIRYLCPEIQRFMVGMLPII
jgi:hypothetical protein